MGGNNEMDRNNEWTFEQGRRGTTANAVSKSLGLGFSILDACSREPFSYTGCYVIEERRRLLPFTWDRMRRHRQTQNPSHRCNAPLKQNQVTVQHATSQPQIANIYTRHSIIIHTYTIDMMQTNRKAQTSSTFPSVYLIYLSGRF